MNIRVRLACLTLVCALIAVVVLPVRSRTAAQAVPRYVADVRFVFSVPVPTHTVQTLDDSQVDTMIRASYMELGRQIRNCPRLRLSDGVRTLWVIPEGGVFSDLHPPRMMPLVLKADLTVTSDPAKPGRAVMRIEMQLLPRAGYQADPNVPPISYPVSSRVAGMSVTLDIESPRDQTILVPLPFTLDQMMEADLYQVIETPNPPPLPEVNTWVLIKLGKAD